MKVFFHNDFYPSYTSDPAAAKGRMDAIVNVISPHVTFVTAECADDADVAAVHTPILSASPPDLTITGTTGAPY